jgi:hypothetical protein
MMWGMVAQRRGVIRLEVEKWNTKERIAWIVIPGCQVSWLPGSPDHDYITHSRALGLTMRLYPSAGGLRTVGEEGD